MRYFEVQLESKSHSDAPNRVHRTVIIGHTRGEVDAECQKMKGIESWSIVREMTRDEVKSYYAD